MSRLLALCGCADLPEFLAMCGCYVLLAGAGALLTLPLLFSPLWWHA